MTTSYRKKEQKGGRPTGAITGSRLHFSRLIWPASRMTLFRGPTSILLRGGQQGISNFSQRFPHNLISKNTFFTSHNSRLSNIWLYNEITPEYFITTNIFKSKRLRQTIQFESDDSIRINHTFPSWALIPNFIDESIPIQLLKSGEPCPVLMRF